jgi:hypothetical protein
MTKFITISTLLTLIFAQKIVACDCDYAGDFLTVAPKASMVELIKITKYLLLAIARSIGCKRT